MVNSVKKFLLLEAEEDDSEQEYQDDEEIGLSSKEARSSLVANSSLTPASLSRRDRAAYLEPIIARYESSFSESPASVQPSPASVQPSPASVQPFPASVQPSPTSVQLFPASVQPPIDFLDADAVAEPQDPLLLGLLGELKKKGSSYDSLDIYSVRCRRGTEKDIVQRIRSDVADNRVSDRVVLNAMCAQYPGRVYLHVLNMSRHNTYLAAYLRLIPGFIYSNSPKISIQEDLTAPRTLSHPDGSTYVVQSSSVPPIWNSVYLDMPVHHIIPFHDTLSVHSSDQQTNPIEIGTWARIRSHGGLYKGDVGIVISVEELHAWLLVVPRLLIPSSSMSKSSGKKRKRTSRPPPTLFTPSIALSLVESEHVDPPVLWCSFEGCDDYTSCEHPKDVVQADFLNQFFEGTLAYVRVLISSLEPATSIPSNLDCFFRQSPHPWLRDSQIIAMMPPSSDWVFEPGKTVVLVNAISAYTDDVLNRLYGIPVGTEGIVKMVKDSQCEVSVSRSNGAQALVEDFYIRKTHLRKKIVVGDTVQIVATGKTLREVKVAGVGHSNAPTIASTDEPAFGLTGSVVEIHGDNVADVVLGNFDARVDVHLNSLLRLHSGSSSGAGVSLPSFSTFQHDRVTEMHRLSAGFSAPGVPPPLPTKKMFTGQFHPWINVEVVVIARHTHKGYHGYVKDVREDQSTKSGLKLLIEYSMPNLPLEWFDYDDIRRSETGRFLHDISTPGPHTSYNFKLGYRPTYSNDELAYFRMPFRKPPLAHIQEQERRQRLMDEDQRERLHLIHLEAERSKGAGKTPPGSRGTTPEPGAPFDPFNPRQPSSSTSQYSGAWIWNPQLKEGLGDREMYLHLNRTDCDPSKDYRVYLRTNLQGTIEAYFRKKHKGGSKASSEIRLHAHDVVLDLDKPKSTSKLEPRPARAAGLYIIIYPFELAGKTGRRVGQEYNKANPVDSKWILQLVHSTKRPGKSNSDRHDEKILRNVHPVTVERNWIVPLHEVIENRRGGNDALEEIRRTYDKKKTK